MSKFNVHFVISKLLVTFVWKIFELKLICCYSLFKIVGRLCRVSFGPLPLPFAIFVRCIFIGGLLLFISTYFSISIFRLVMAFKVIHFFFYYVYNTNYIFQPVNFANLAHESMFKKIIFLKLFLIILTILSTYCYPFIYQRGKYYFSFIHFPPLAFILTILGHFCARQWGSLAVILPHMLSSPPTFWCWLLRAS